MVACFRASFSLFSGQLWPLYLGSSASLQYCYSQFSSRGDRRQRLPISRWGRRTPGSLLAGTSGNGSLFIAGAGRLPFSSRWGARIWYILRASFSHVGQTDTSVEVRQMRRKRQRIKFTLGRNLSSLARSCSERSEGDSVIHGVAVHQEGRLREWPVLSIAYQEGVDNKVVLFCFVRFNC